MSKKDNKWYSVDVVCIIIFNSHIVVVVVVIAVVVDVEVDGVVVVVPVNGKTVAYAPQQ